MFRGLAVLTLSLMLSACGDDGSSAYGGGYGGDAEGGYEGAASLNQQRAPRFALRGPFATARRANEVCNGFLQQGYDAIYYHSGDGYYVKIKH